MAKTYQTVFELGGKLNSTFLKAFGQANKSAGELRNEIAKVQKNSDFQKAAKSTGVFQGALKKVVAAATAATIAIGGISAATSAVNTAMDFEAQIDSIQAVSGMADSEMSKIQALALEMGAKTKYSALEAAQGMEELIKAGMSAQQVMDGGAEAALNLAAAGEIGLADSAEIMSTAMNAFKKDGMAAADAANILAGTANASATGVEDLRQSLAAVSAVASGAGMSFKDTNIALGLFANNGLKSSDAGTSLKTMLSNLQPTTKAQIEQFRALGLITADGSNQFFDAAGNLKSLGDISGLLRKSMKGLTNQQRMLAMETMFGSDAIRAANILFNEGAEGVQKFDSDMSNVTALDVATKRMDNAKGAVEQFNGAMETLKISALMPTMPLIKKVALAAADFAGKMTEWLSSEQAKKWGDTLRGAVGFVGGAFRSLWKVIGPIAAGIGNTFTDMFSGGDLKGGMAGLFGEMKGLAQEWGGALVDLWPTVKSVFGSIGSIFKQLLPLSAKVALTIWTEFTKVWKALLPVGIYIQQKLWPILSKVFGFIAHDVTPAISRAFSAMLPTFLNVAGKIGQTISALFNFVKPIINALVGVFNFAFPIIKSVVLAAIHSVSGVFNGLMTTLGGVLDFITGVFSGNWGKAWEGLVDIFSGVFSALGSILKVPINAVIGLINQAFEKIGSISIDIPDWVPGLGGKTFGVDLPQIPLLATGGVATGPTLAMVGEGREDEAILPLSKLDSMLQSRSPSGQAGSAGVTIQITNSPKIYVSGSATEQDAKRIAAASNDDLEKRLRALKKQKQRVSFA